MMELEKLVEDYQQNVNRRSEETIRAMGNIEVLGFVGTTASGKTSTIHKVIEIWDGADLIQNETSRRAGTSEQSGTKEYVFRSQEGIVDDIKNGRLVQVALGPNGDLYCTRPAGYPKGKVGTIALVPPAVEEFRRLPVKYFQAVYMVPESFDAWQSWFNNQAADREWDEADKHGRLEQSRQSYDFALSDPDIRFILNDNILSAAKRVLQVLQGQAPTDEELAKRTAAVNLARLNKQFEL